MGLKTKISIDEDTLFSTASEERKEEKLRKMEEDRLSKQNATKSLDETPEEEMLLDRKVVCKLCDKQITYKSPKTSKIRRLEAGPDLRPVAKGIDTLKYEVISCPFCGYTAMTRYYDNISMVQLKMIKEMVTENFEPEEPWSEPTYSYEYAIDRYNLALVNAVAKKGKISERAYICLNLSWLMRARAEEIGPAAPGYTDTCVEAERYYRQAYDGFVKAMSSEYFPMCGMDQYTLEYLLAYMAYYFDDVQTSAKLISGLITNKNVTKRLKDRAINLKEQMMDDIKSGKIKLKK